MSCNNSVNVIFQSTRPSRGATLTMISTAPPVAHFNPRAPRGARLVDIEVEGNVVTFQSTRPSRGATDVAQVVHAQWIISIHAPLAGRDLIDSTFIRKCQ